MTEENYNKATKLLEGIDRDTKRLERIKEFNSTPIGSNHITQKHRTVLTSGKGREEYFYLEVMTPEMVKYLAQQEIQIITARITKNKILLSKL